MAKYSFKNLSIILLWLFFCAALGLAFAPVMGVEVEPLTINPFVIAGFVIGIMLAGAVIWFQLIKRKKVDVDSVFITLTGIVVADVLAHFGVGTSGNTRDNVLALMGVFFAVMIAYGLIIRNMQASWEGTKRWIWASNFFQVVLIASTAALVGSLVPPIAAILIFVGAAIYDAVAVWWLGSMQVMANAFLDKRVIPGIGFAREEEGKFGILGGGDLFFLVFVPVAFYKSYPPLTLWLMGAELFGLLALFVFSRKEKSYPALPYMLWPIVPVFVALWFHLI